MMIERDLTWGGEHTYNIQIMYCRITPETYIILLTNVTPINSV